MAIAPATIYDAESAIRPELARNERLLWSGQPRGGVAFTTNDIFMIPFTIVWCGFAVVWELAALSHGVGGFSLFGLPFVGVGLYMVAGRFIGDARRRHRTFYGITNERVIIVSGSRTREVNSLPLDTMNDITFKEKADGSGTIMLARPNPLMTRRNTIALQGMNRMAGVPSLELIPNARDVYQLLLQARRDEPYVPNAA
jgi:hypothetical protein